MPNGIDFSFLLPLLYLAHMHASEARVHNSFHLLVQVILPEGASNIKAKVPFQVEQSQDIRQTYLDTQGRPVVVLHKKNAVPDHDVPFTVTYTFARYLMLREPLMLITAFALLFASVVAYSRCEFTLVRDDKWRADRQQEKAVAVVQQIAAVIAGKTSLYPYDNLLLSSTGCLPWSEQSPGVHLWL